MTREKTILVQAISFLALLVFVFASQASAGWIVTMESGGEEDPLQKTSVIIYLQKGLGFKTATPEGDMMIQRVDTRETYIIDAGEREYEVTSWDEMSREMAGASAEMKKALEEMEKEMADAPPEMREMLRQQMEQMQSMFGEAEEKPVHVEKTGEKRKVLGYKAEQYLVFEDNIQTQELWVSNARKLRGLIEEWKEVTEPMFEEIAEAFPAAGAGRYVEAMKEIEGFPLLTIVYQGGCPGKLHRLLISRRRSLVTRTFSRLPDIPKGKVDDIGKYAGR